MNIDPFLAWVESTALSQWVVGSPSMFAFPGILTLHAIGMGFAVGISAAIDLRILGVAPKVPLRELRRFLPILWAGFWLNAVSGVLLLIGYPTKALTNPVFYLKLTLIAVAMVLLVRISRQVFATGSGGSLNPLDALDPPISSRLRNLATASLICWAGAITAGRLLAYTYHRLTQLH
ncbi:MAG: hypothetical protein ABW318_05395 [Vicinamibacterales bacterium]